MRLEQKFVVDHEIGRVWRAFGDLQLLADCMPGAELVSVSPDMSEVEGRIRVKVGPIIAAFSGQAKVYRDDANCRGNVEGIGLDKNNGSRTQIKLSYALEPIGASTKVSTVSDVVLTGLMAQFSKGALINELAAQMTAQFAQRLQQRLQVDCELARPAPTPQRSDDNDVKPLQLFLAVMKRRLAALFQGLLGQTGAK